jgi:hypothetical protein
MVALPRAALTDDGRPALTGPHHTEAAGDRRLLDSGLRTTIGVRDPYRGVMRARSGLSDPPCKPEPG